MQNLSIGGHKEGQLSIFIKEKALKYRVEEKVTLSLSLTMTNVLLPKAFSCLLIWKEKIRDCELRLATQREGQETVLIL